MKVSIALSTRCSSRPWKWEMLMNLQPSTVLDMHSKPHQRQASWQINRSWRPERCKPPRGQGFVVGAIGGVIEALNTLKTTNSELKLTLPAIPCRTKEVMTMTFSLDTCIMACSPATPLRQGYNLKYKINKNIMLQTIK